MTRPATTDPADGLPRTVRAARATVPGRPSLSGPPLEREGGKTSTPTPAADFKALLAAAGPDPASPGTCEGAGYLAGPDSPAGPAASPERSPGPGRGDPGFTPPRPGQGALPTWPAPPEAGNVLLHLRIGIPPVAAARPRVSPAEYTRIGAQKVKTKKAHAYNTSAYEDYKTAVGWLLRRARVPRNDSDELGVYGVFHLAGGAGAADGDNLLKAIVDAGNGITWKDDRQFTVWLARVIRGSADPHTDLVVYVAGLPGESPSRSGSPVRPHGSGGPPAGAP